MNTAQLYPQRTYVVILTTNAGMNALSVTGHIVDGEQGGHCIPLEGRAGWDHLLTIVGQLNTLEQNGELAVCTAIVEGQPKNREQRGTTQ